MAATVAVAETGADAVVAEGATDRLMNGDSGHSYREADKLKVVQVFGGTESAGGIHEYSVAVGIGFDAKPR